ncbi:hypothetical protein Tc00.1047053506627.70 [Trypanosoma cruzi]|uniref:Uncharacterized protein n=1 Tax=Trypanosoma cruzi (strain CL Brener) TaxID=353153 RepID=Q4D9C8_TRYCC|nr:hypothetical protein Tc00.1047053506627.70 [Trypanosoma cruzi]EAN89131.1 hypothetical protein Tc00.1047053506627.70 [Trypanosoma cruzi]|eukprot:XP_810982.1 hypothetical protein [Trypanosoma cruzi strain CL Brener]
MNLELMKMESCREANGAPLLPLSVSFPFARQELYEKGSCIFGNWGRCLKAQPNDSPVPRMEIQMGNRWQGRSSESRVHRALSWSHREESEKPCGIKAHRCRSRSALPMAVDAIGGSFPVLGTTDNGGDIPSASGENSVENGKKEVPLGRCAALLHAREDRAPVLESACCSNVPNDCRLEEKCEENFSLASSTRSTAHHEASPHSTAFMPTSEHVHGLAQLMDGLQHAILQLSGEMRELRLAFQQMRGSFMSGRQKTLSRPPLVGPMAVTTPDQPQEEPAPSSSSSSLTFPRRTEDLSFYSASPPLHPEGSTAFLDAGIVNAVSDGLKELEALPTFLPFEHRVVI